MEKDLRLKRYLCDNERFADLVNGFVGEPLVSAENLTDLDSQTGMFSTVRNRFWDSGKQKYRDLLKKAAFGVNFAVIGVENQESVHYLMPLRCMVYDAGEYERQASGIRKLVRRKKKLTADEFLSGFTRQSRLKPCVTLVIYFGENWDGPDRLHDLIDFTDIPERIRSLVNDYPIYVLEVRKLASTDMFCTDLKQVFDSVRYSNDPVRFHQMVLEDPAYRSLDEDAYDIIAEYTDTSEMAAVKEFHREGDRINMCGAIRELIREGRMEGIKQGIERGIEQGTEQGMKILCETCCELGVSRADTAAKVEEKYQITPEQAEEYVKKYWK